jgi:hypothetical protein
MNATHLNEHDANQGAQSCGEFLGMTGNSGWYLLCSGGATVLMVILLWGMLGVSLLLCLLVGLSLGTLSVAYVFALKNNRPAHYDTDFFEAALVEAGVLGFVFGPRSRRPENPFDGFAAASPGAFEERKVSHRRDSRPAAAVGPATACPAHPEAAGPQPLAIAMPEAARAASSAARAKEAEPMVTRRECDRLREELTEAHEMLDDALTESAEG